MLPGALVLVPAGQWLIPPFDRLVVVQQPQRARMCGFGDKDRRPITPPPCVRLMVIDKKTGKEVNCKYVTRWPIHARLPASPGVQLPMLTHVCHTARSSILCMS